MLPTENTLTVSNGIQIVVDSYGDVHPDDEYCGVFGSDHRYLTGLQTSLSTEYQSDLDVLGQTVEGGSITTTLASAASGAGRGEQRVWTLRKAYTITEDRIELRITLQNNSSVHQSPTVAVELSPDYAHVFEVGAFFSQRKTQERQVQTKAGRNRLILSADCIDDQRREIEVTFSGTPNVSIEGERGHLRWSPDVGPSSVETFSAQFELPEQEGICPTITPETEGSHDEIVAAATSTLESLMLPGGITAAGTPRFLAPFGRDALVVSYQLLPYDSTVATNTLRYLASYQGRENDNETLEESGRIFHEQRSGDLVTEGISLRRPYYGTVDATPLFVALYSDTYRTTGDTKLRDEVYDEAVASVNWTIDSLDTDSLLGYRPHNHPYGLTHLGWKDSSSAIARPDGTPANGSIRLAEVQGYVYRALTRFAPVAEEVGETELADTCLDTATAVSEAFEDLFWLPDEGCYALAVDDAGAVESVASNQTHAIWGGLGTEARVERAVRRLMEPDMFSSHGLRTFAKSHPAFDSLSYHRGSIWPHDNSIAAMGLAERGHHDAARQISESGLELLRMHYERGRPNRYGFPELVPGVSPDGEVSEVLHHPDSCEPAAWSAGSVFGFLQALSSSKSGQAIDE